MTPEEARQRAEDFRRNAMTRFPLELIETTGSDVGAKWKELRSAGRGYPVVLGWAGDDDPLGNLLLPFGPAREGLPPPMPVDEIAKAAAAIRFPADLAAKTKAESEAAERQLGDQLAADPKMPLPRITATDGEGTRELSREETIAAIRAEPRDPPLGKWPASPQRNSALSVARRALTGELLPRVLIGLAPTEDWTLIPAHLHWGGWNACPSAEYHVAALRSLRDRYGAVLVGMNADTINLWVATKPQTREEALALAREIHVYCPDLIDQDLETYSALAADLMANEWWNFWWD